MVVVVDVVDVVAVVVLLLHLPLKIQFATNVLKKKLFFLLINNSFPSRHLFIHLFRYLPRTD